MTSRKHSIIILTVFFICLAMLGSFLFIAANAEHECTHDDDCTVCCLIDMCINAVRSSFIASAAVYVTVVFAAVSVSAFCAAVFMGSADSLITLKTELRN